MKLNVAHEDQVEIGQYLTCRDPEVLPAISKELKIEFNFKQTDKKLLVTNGLACVLHKGPKAFEAVIDEVQTQDSDGNLHYPKFISSAAKVICKVHLNEPMVLKKFDSILLRDLDSNMTFGMGEITKYKPHDLGETSPLYKKRQLAEADKVR